MPPSEQSASRNGGIRVRVFVLALAIPLALTAALVVFLRGGRDEVARQATQSSEAGDASPPGATGDGSSGAPAGAAAKPRLVRVGTFDSPVYVTAPPGDRRRLFVVEQGGRVRVLVGGKLRKRPFLDVSGRVTAGGEQGLLSLALAPDYARSGRFYVHYTDTNGNIRVVEFRRSRRDPDRASIASARQILFARHPFSNHNGGLLLFGPDRHLYVGMGDGGSGDDPFNNAQNLNSLLGKILRIDPKRSGRGGHTSPRSNPFAARAGRNEIYSYGLRNPWRFSFDRANGDLYIGDVGQNEREEIDYARRGQAGGRNFGWSCFEGRSRHDSSRNCPGAVPPVLDYPLSDGACAVTGGVVVRDPALPSLAGRYLYGDFCRGRVRSFRIAGGRATGDRALGLRVDSLSSFGEDARGRVYLVSLSGPVYRLAAR